MKYALTIPLCILTFLLAGQEDRMDYFFFELTAEIDQPYLHTNGEQCFSSTSTPWIVNSIVDDCRAPSSFYWQKDLSPILNWEIGIKEEDVSRPVEAAWHGDTLIVLGIEPCFTGPTLISKVGKFDTSGNLLASASYFSCLENAPIFVVEPREQDNTCPILAVDEGGTIFFTTAYGLMKLDANGNLFPQTININMDALIGVIDLPGTNLGVATPTEVAVVDWTTDSILLSIEHEAIAMTAADGMFWCISEGNFYRIGADLSTGVWALPEGDAMQIRLTTYEDRPLVYKPDGPDFKAWLFNIETETFDLLIDWEIEGVEIFAVEPFRQDTFLVSGQLDNGRRGFVKKATPSSFTFQYPYDLGIRSVDLELLNIDEDVEASGETYNYSVTFRQTVEIKNYGEGVINEFVLEWNTRHDWCGIPGYLKMIDLEMHPGDIQVIEDTLWHNFSTSEPILTDSLIYTFNTFGPNHYLDANDSNDTMTGELMVTSLDRKLIPETAIKLFPNPADGLVHLEADLPIDKVEFYDVFGRLIHTLELDRVYQLELDRQGLPSGVYLLRLQSGNQYGFQRLVWRAN
ncbi:MAG: T9SS type A sorting domain-containing protein [Phaeodactylibacter sp.]|nr:T9SS type A sorting domain-containing protein [Phaeodactylibacter sp.]